MLQIDVFGFLYGLTTALLQVEQLLLRGCTCGLCSSPLMNKRGNLHLRKYFQIMGNLGFPAVVSCMWACSRGAVACGALLWQAQLVHRALNFW